MLDGYDAADETGSNLPDMLVLGIPAAIGTKHNLFCIVWTVLYKRETELGIMIPSGFSDDISLENDV